MNTMSLYETGDSTGEASLKDIFEDRMENAITGNVTVEQLIYYAVRGGWLAIWKPLRRYAVILQRNI